MRKINILIIMLLVIGSSLLGCKKDASLQGGTDGNDTGKRDVALKDGSGKGEDTNDDIEDKVFRAEVIDTDGGLLITPDKESDEYLSSDRIIVSTKEAEVLDNKGEVIDIDILKPGDMLRITYDGSIRESYPAQITGKKIELIGHNDLIDGLFALIDDVYQADSGLNGDISIIAFDTTEWTMLSDIETEIILSLVKKEYELEVVKGTFDELAEQGLIDKDILYFETGILIEIKDIEVSKDQEIIECSVKKWRSGLGAIGWNAKAKLKNDKWEITKNNMWIS